MMSNVSQLTESSLAHDIAASCLYTPAHFQVQLEQTKHRLDLLSKWPIKSGDRVLELGCGQGDCTAVLAELVGDAGQVTAVDPAPLDYGAPHTLGQAQAHLSKGRLGTRITWVQASPSTYLESHPDEIYDIAVLAHCLWYFSSPEQIENTLRTLATRAKHVCVAEWSLSSATWNANTHILAVLAQAAMECRKPQSESNVRTVVSPASIKTMAGKAGLTLQNEELISPGKGVFDGRWEVQAVLDPGFLKEIDEFVTDDREKGVVLAMRDSVVASVERAGGIKEVRSMDAWSAVFATRIV